MRRQAPEKTQAGSIAWSEFFEKRALVSPLFIFCRNE